MDVPSNIPPHLQYLYDVRNLSQAVQDGSDIIAEAERRRREIGYQIDQYPAQTTGQPYN